MALLGWFVHRDYGLSWDEPIVLEYGHQILAYLQDGDPAFSKTFDRYHGSFPPLWMAAVDSFFSEASTQERYFWIRKINFSFYLLGGTLLGLLARKTWGNKEGCLILVLWLLSPRIFADAFYNTKDIPFLSLSILCTWT
jgi:hypothetical protein